MLHDRTGRISANRLDELIELLEQLSPDNADSSVMDIARAGDEHHLATLQRLDAARGGGSLYAQAAEAVARRLAKP